MGKIKFLKGTGAFPTSGLKTEALYFSIPSDEKFEIGLATTNAPLLQKCNYLCLSICYGESIQEFRIH